MAIIVSGRGFSRMRLETLLPLGKVDPGLRTPDRPLDVHAVARDASFLETVAVRDDVDRSRLADLARTIQAHDDAAARREIVG